VKRILMRAPKTPFEVLSPERTAATNSIAANSGNLVFIEAAWKLLSVPGAQLTPDRLRHDPSRADEINERFDVYVIPLANAFRLSFARNLASITELVRRLRIPVVVLGVGAQGSVDYRWDAIRPMDPVVRSFMSAVLDHAPSVGVRGEGTAAYLRGLGFRDIDVIGCPSMFVWRDGLRMRERTPELAPDARIAVTISPYRRAMGRIANHNLRRYPNLVYIAQDLTTLELLLDGTPLPDGRADSELPLHPAHPLFREGRTRFYPDPWPWIRDLRSMDYVFGSRIHGTIAALLAGTPATVLAHDSRTLELAQYFEIPHRLLRDVPVTVDAAELYAEADTTALVAGHARRLATFVDFLDRQGLDHAYAHPWAFADFEQRIADTVYPAAVTGRRTGPLDPGDLVRRMTARARRFATAARHRRDLAALERRT
jgi:hypothetical protein